MVRIIPYLNSNAYNRRTRPGIDGPLARHLSHLFIRDPTVIFPEPKDQNDEHSMNHFEVGHLHIPSIDPEADFEYLLEHIFGGLPNREAQTPSS